MHAMALPSLATRPPAARREPVALVDTENGAPAPPSAAASALLVESIMLYLVAKRRLGFHVFIMGGASGA